MARSSLLLCAIMLGATTIAVATTASVANATGTCTNLHHNSGTETSKYASRKADDYGACCTICAVDVNCGHFVWEPNTKHGCHLKKGAIDAAGLKHHPGYVAGEAVAPLPPPPPPPPPPAPPLPPLPQPLGYLPHLIFFLADDWGHYNAGWHGNKEARTPNMDALVSEGVVLDRHYVYQFCSPTRSSLLSGRLPIHMNTRNMAPTALGGVDLRASTIADKMRSVGYRTHQVGKWNAGSLLYGQVPTERGFETSFGYMSGEEDHYTQIGGYGKVPVDYMPDDLLSGSGYTAGEQSLTGGWDASKRPKLVDLLESGVPALGMNGPVPTPYAAPRLTEHRALLSIDTTVRCADSAPCGACQSTCNSDF